MSAPLLALSAGVISSVGPCAAPRLLAVSALASGLRARYERYAALAALGLGICLVYVLLGMVIALFAIVTKGSTWIYALSACAFAYGGLRLLCTSDSCHSHATKSPHPPHSIGAAFLLGASFGLVLSPCCTPVIAAIAVFETGSDAPGLAMLTLLAFALGHVLPLMLVGSWLADVRRIFEHLEGAIGTVSAALLLALAGYYALLA